MQIVTNNKERILPIIGAGLLFISLFLPWDRLYFGQSRTEHFHPGYLHHFGFIAGGIGILVLLIAIAKSKPGKIQAIAFIMLGVAAITIPSFYTDFLYSGDVDCFQIIKDPTFQCASIVVDFGLEIVHLGASFIILGGLIIWKSSSDFRNKKSFSTTFITAEQGQFNL